MTTGSGTTSAPTMGMGAEGTAMVTGDTDTEAATEDGHCED
jgi:hypothetical protein